MRIFTVTYDGRPAAVVRAADGAEAIALARALGGGRAPSAVTSARGFDAREPDDAEMVSWLARRADHLIAENLIVEAGAGAPATSPP